MTLVGAGVVGLTCAVRLLEAGHRVDVVARDLPLETTSTVAGAVWSPHRVGDEDRARAWARRSYAVFDGLAGQDAGVRMLSGTAFDDGSDPWWLEELDGVHEKPGAWTFPAPVIETPVYMAWLRARVEALGGTVTRLCLGGLPTASGGIVVNCSGLGSRLLADDPSVTPVAGQVVVVQQFGLVHWWLSPAEQLVVVPRAHEIVVGGTYDEGSWSRTPSMTMAAAILARAARLVPELERARVLRHQVGLRPMRASVRLERVGDVVHCYGHGGAGVTLAWGCAEEVVALL